VDHFFAISIFSLFLSLFSAAFATAAPLIPSAILEWADTSCLDAIYLLLAISCASLASDAGSDLPVAFSVEFLGVPPSTPSSLLPPPSCYGGSVPDTSGASS